MNDKDFEDMGISQVVINPHQNSVCVHCNDCVIVHLNITLHIIVYEASIGPIIY